MIAKNLISFYKTREQKLIEGTAKFKNIPVPQLNLLKIKEEFDKSDLGFLESDNIEYEQMIQYLSNNFSITVKEVERNYDVIDYLRQSIHNSYKAFSEDVARNILSEDAKK